MRRLLVWTWKEAREHAARVRLLLVSIPVLTLLAGGIWSHELTAGRGDELAFSFVAAALVLHGLVLASGLFATDVGESAPAPAQRLPGGLGAAFVAKALTWLTTALVAVLVGTFATAGVLWLVGQPERAWDILTPWHHSDGLQQAAFVGEALVYSACVALAAACVRHPGSAVAAGTILFGVLLGTVLLGWRADSRVFPMHASQSLVLEGLTLVVLGIAVVAAWLVGRRRVAAGWRAAALAAGVIVALFGAGAVHAARTIERVREPDAAAQDWRIEHVLVGKGAHHAFAQLERHIGAWPLPANARDEYRAVCLVDLERGEWRRLGDRGGTLSFLPHHLWGRAHVPPMHAYERVVLTQCQDRLDPLSVPSEVVWFDGATGAFVHQELDGYPDPRGVGYMRDLLRDISSVRDSQGRRTWLYDGFLEREGGGAPIGVPQVGRAQQTIFPVVPSPDAWVASWMAHRTGIPRPNFIWTEADTGRVIEAPSEEYGPAFRLSKGRILAQRSPENDLRTASWQVVDIATQQATVAPGAPSGWPRTSWPVCTLAGDRVLVSAKRESGVALSLWDPLGGGSAPLRVPELGAAIQTVSPTGPDVQGRLALRLGCGEAHGDAWVVLSAHGERVRLLLRPGRLAGWLEPLHIQDDGAVLFLVDQRRIVRVGPERDQIQTLFPREVK